ncbi:MAG: IS1096 element passenger TnpR family protein [Moorellales bacterium]
MRVAVAREKVSPALAIYQFKVTLKGIRPPIWRRFQVPNHITLVKADVKVSHFGRSVFDPPPMILGYGSYGMWCGVDVS